MLVGSRLTFVAVFACSAFFSANGQLNVPIPHVKLRINNSADDIKLVDKEGTLTFDQTLRKISFHARGQDLNYSIEISYQDVVAIVFDTSTHMRGGVLADVLNGGIGGGRLGDPIGTRGVMDHWMHITAHERSGANRTTMFEIPSDSSAAVIASASDTFSGLVSNATVRRGTDIKKNDLKDVESRHFVKADWTVRPVPEIQPGKALVIVVCPPSAARTAGKGHPVESTLTIASCWPISREPTGTLMSTQECIDWQRSLAMQMR